MMHKGRIFLVDDDELIVSMLARAIKSVGHDVRFATDTKGIVEKISSWSPDITLLDINLPGMSGIEILEQIKEQGLRTQVVMITADNTAETSVQAMKIGAVDYLTKPFNIDEVLIVLDGILEKERLKDEVDYFKKLYAEKYNKKIIGTAPATLAMISEIEQLAKAGVSTVMITGESGTGKELIASNLFHSMFADKKSPFIRVNCAALPETLLETELFGYVKGAFTDAKKDKKGLFELADGGCLLLDEIAEMKVDLQSKLLRVLEEKAIRRVAGSEEIPVNVTVLATTNKNVEEEVEKGNFRLDLFYRLNTFCLQVPALRERQEDIPQLANYFLEVSKERYKKTDLVGFEPETMEMMLAYRWPGNIRECKNVIERMVVLKNTTLFKPEHLPREIQQAFSTSGHVSTTDSSTFILPKQGINLEELEKDFIRQALQLADGNQSNAAKLLHMSYDSFRYHLKKYGLK